MLFLYRPRETWMPFTSPRGGTQQAAYNRRLQEQFQSTRRCRPPPGPTELDPVAALKELAALHQSGVLTDAEFAAPRHGSWIDDVERTRATMLFGRCAPRSTAIGRRWEAFSPTMCAHGRPPLATSSLGELLDELDRRDESFSGIELDRRSTRRRR